MTGVNHTDRAHALLSASGADRWMNCTPSARLEEKHGAPERTSVYADEGTLAHELADIELRRMADQLTTTQYLAAYKKITEDPLYSPEMDEEVGKYTDYVLEQFLGAKKRDKTAELIVEQKLDLTEYIPEGFGTNDTAIIADGEMEIVDLKYGKGIAVDAQDNPQLRVYAVGALVKNMLLYDITSVRMTIVQPRLDSISSQKMPIKALLQWADKALRPKAKLAWEGKGDLNPGAHCKWCRVKARCPALADYNLAMAKHDFAAPELLTDAQVIEVFERAPMLEDWAKSVAQYMLDEALHGKEWPGYKVVEGRSQRKWADESKAIAALLKKGFKEDQFTVTKLQGIGHIEKLVGKQDFPKILGDTVIKPPGKPTLAPESDKRPAFGIEQAKQDFK